MSAKRMSLKEIAVEASVSPALVSNVLNGKGRASRPVRQRIIEMLEDHGYKPSYKRRPIVLYSPAPPPGQAMDSYMRYVSASLLDGIAWETNRAGLNLTVETHGGDQAVSRIFDQEPCGILVRTGSESAEVVLQRAGRARLPAVQVGYDTESPDHHAVVIDSQDGAYRATLSLIERGHKRIACIRWCRNSENSMKKLAGFTQAMNEAGLAIDATYIIDVAESRMQLRDPDRMRQGREAVMQLLALPRPPTAVFVDNNFISLPLIFPLKEDRGEFPQAISGLEIIHFGDVDLMPAFEMMIGSLNYAEPRYRHMRVNWFRIGTEVVQTLLGIINEGYGLDTSTERRIRRVSPEIGVMRNGRFESYER